MGLFSKKNQEPERTDDERLRNLESINRSYTTIGVYGEALSPRDVERAIKTAIRDMRELVERERTCRVERMEIDEFGRYFYLSCGHMQMTHNTSAMPYCPNCGARVIGGSA